MKGEKKKEKDTTTPALCLRPCLNSGRHFSELSGSSVSEQARCDAASNRFPSAEAQQHLISSGVQPPVERRAIWAAVPTAGGQSVKQEHVAGTHRPALEEEGGEKKDQLRTLQYSPLGICFIGADICYNIVIMCNQMGAVLAKWTPPKKERKKRGGRKCPIKIHNDSFLSIC